jgi:3'(2'), 5'-bisphosphate nucleotidase
VTPPPSRPLSTPRLPATGPRAPRGGGAPAGKPFPTPRALVPLMETLPRAGRAELAAARALARTAGAAAMRFYGSAVAEDKGGSPVTAADRAAHEVICEGLREAFPGDAVLSEEGSDSEARLDAERVWIVDPLDGTREFLAGNGEFAVMIGLAVEGRAELGVVYLPAADTLYFAASGRGAWMERGGARTRLRALECSPGALRLVGSRSHPDPLLTRMQVALGITDVRPSGSVGVKCGLIARGERDLYVHPVPYLKEWDTCAPEVVLREAGGMVTDCLGGELRYNKPRPVQPHGIVACGPGAGGEVLARIGPLYGAAGAT